MEQSFIFTHADLYEKGDGNSGEFSAGERKQAVHALLQTAFI